VYLSSSNLEKKNPPLLVRIVHEGHYCTFSFCYKKDSIHNYIICKTKTLLG
jgi:hypothetical protein